MQTAHALFNDPHAAEQLVARLAGMGVPHNAIHVFGAAGHMGSFADSESHIHSIERDHMGSFADSESHAHDTQRDHMGSFADKGEHAHDAERDTVASFASTDRGTAKQPALTAELIAAGLAPADADKAARSIATGMMLIVVHAPADQASAVAAALSQ